MTDEERAEEILQTKGSMTFCAKGCVYTEKVKELIIIGFSEGKKEKCLEQNKDGTIRPCEVMKENEQLKKEISVLLSCSNCPENKGGYICEKEYNDKCLAQKIEYIKELKEENEELLESCKDKDCQLNKWFISYNEVLKEKEEQKARIEKQKEINKEYVDENEELKKKLSLAGYRIAELKIEIDELKAHCKTVDEVNEKMKNMCNCDNAIQNNGEFFCPYFDYYGSMTCCNCDKWELKKC